jgi:3alpha(or 20beta)-hydroxysteroid dehydrogenase
MARLDGKVAIVTGGARGIGAAAAAALAAEGAAVIVADLLDDAGQATAAAIEAAGGTAPYVHLDVTDRAAWDASIGATLERFGRIDCLVNNAGIDMSATIEDITIENFRRVIEINLYGGFHGMQAVIPVMKRQGGGSIVNIASLATRKVAPTTAAYGAAKAGFANLTKTAAIHCARQGYGIRINSVHPGPIETPMLFGGTENRGDSPDVKRVIDIIPMGRLGQPADIGSVVVFLASDDSRYMTAEELYVDGGLSPI